MYATIRAVPINYFYHKAKANHSLFNWIMVL